MQIEKTSKTKGEKRKNNSKTEYTRNKKNGRHRLTDTIYAKSSDVRKINVCKSAEGSIKLLVWFDALMSFMFTTHARRPAIAQMSVRPSVTR